MNDDDDVSAGWFEAFSTRAALRTVTLFIAGAVCYMALAAIYKHRLSDDFAQADLVRSMQIFASLTGLSLVFAFCHAHMPSEVSEVNARITSRGVLRWLAMTGCCGLCLTAQVGAWWAHDIGAAFVGTVVSGVVWILFTAIYARYANGVNNDRIASKRSICANGTARDALLKMAGITCVSFVFCGLASAQAPVVLKGICASLLTAVVFAITSAFLVKSVDIDYDRG